jgi:polar amino acid transport system substrate-binding protein
MFMKLNTLPVFIVFFCVIGIGFIALKLIPAFISSRQSSDDSLVRIKQKGSLVVGTNAEYEPTEFYDTSHQIVGFDIDIAKEIAKSLGVTLTVKDYPWNDLFAAVKNHQVDMAICSITITPERSKIMLFSHPYFDNGQAILTKKSTGNILTPKDLTGKKVGVQRETTGKEAASKYVDPSLLIEYGTTNSSDTRKTTDVADDLISGKLDAFVQDYIVLANMVKKNPQLKIAGEPFTQEYYGIATAIGNTAFIDEVNKILNSLKRNGHYEQIQNRWITN